MRLEHYSVDKLKNQINDIVGKYLDLSLYHVFFFGSRVTESNSQSSDIDIGIEGPEKIPARIISEIKEDLDNLPTLYKFDLVDFKQVTPNFREETIKNIEYVN